MREARAVVSLEGAASFTFGVANVPPASRSRPATEGVAYVNQPLRTVGTNGKPGRLRTTVHTVAATSNVTVVGIGNHERPLDRRTRTQPANSGIRMSTKALS